MRIHVIKSGRAIAGSFTSREKASEALVQHFGDNCTIETFERGNTTAGPCYGGDPWRRERRKQQPWRFRE